MSDDELRQFRNQMRAALQRLLETGPTEDSPEGKIYRVFYRTSTTHRVSRDSRQSAASTTPISAPGLKGRKYPTAFLEAVKREGFGRLAETVDGRNYLQYVDADATSLPRRPWAIAKRARRARLLCRLEEQPVPAPRTARAHRLRLCKK